MSDILRFKDDIDTNEYYKRCIHKNLGSKGEIEYFSKVDLSEHDEAIRNKTIEDIEKFLDKIALDKVAEIKCDDGEIRNRPLIDFAKVYEILEQLKE